MIVSRRDVLKSMVVAGVAVAVPMTVMLPAVVPAARKSGLKPEQLDALEHAIIKNYRPLYSNKPTSEQFDWLVATTVMKQMKGSKA